MNEFFGFNSKDYIMMTDEPFGGLSRAMSLFAHGNSSGVDEGIGSKKRSQSQEKEER